MKFHNLYEEKEKFFREKVNQNFSIKKINKKEINKEIIENKKEYKDLSQKNTENDIFNKKNGFSSIIKINLQD